MQDKRLTFYKLLGNTLLASLTNSFVWFALTFWVFLETQSVLATSVIAGTFAVMNMLGALNFGHFVDKHKKKTAMTVSSIASLAAYLLGAAVFFTAPPEAFNNIASPYLWVLIIVLMLGAVVGNLRTIALSTTVSYLFDEGRDKANGLIGTANGISFSLTSILSGLTIGFYGMNLAIICAIIATAVALLHLLTIRFDESAPHARAKADETPKEQKPLPFSALISIVAAIPGLFGLIFFTTFNNFLGGVFMALMDAYGLSLVSVQTWGIMFAVLGLGFILGGTYIAKRGLGPYPLKLMLSINVVTWTTCIFFTIQPSIILLAIGIFIWITLAPFIEATEQTLIQSIVPYEQQGRVFGFAQSIESAATPITAFFIGPIAQLIFIPFMTTGAGVALIGGWFGTGMNRGIALVFIFAGIIGLAVTLLAFRSRSYKVLSERYTATIKA